MVELRKPEKLEDQKGQPESSSSTTTLTVPPVVDYGSAAAYAIELRKWLFTTHCWAFCHQMATMHSLAYLASCNRPEIMVPQSPLGVTLPPSSVPPPTTNLSNSNQFIQRHAISSFTRRILAEIVDSIFAFIAKLLIVYLLVEIGVVDLDKYDRLLGDEADLHTLIDVTQELFPIEMLAKIVVSIVEALFVSYGFGSVPAGQTPGKVVLNIQVITCYQVIPIAGSEEVNIVRTLTVPFKNSLLRSLTKNMLINLLFPLSAAAYAFTYNRAGYDIAARTIVVNA
ncbi:RDD family protein [Loa loa]|uniref:RDD family protein n=1 Tax=Loa loa TaxID=7209 RepID=A0A1I7VNY8_LOALO|nr:RDD family protein [Loa loa]EFO25878.1 RDD family protein [Loa loa]